MTRAIVADDAAAFYNLDILTLDIWEETLSHGCMAT
jgi:hypothetical protein